MSLEAMKQVLLNEIDLVLTDPETILSYGAKRALQYVEHQLQAIAEAENKRAALQEIIKNSEKHNTEWDAKSADEQAAYHAENACPYCGGSGHKDDL